MPPLARRIVPPAAARWRQRLREASGAERWRLLGEFAASPECAALLQAEFPRLATALAMNRREFFRYGAAAMALAGLGGCGHPPAEEIVPMRQQEEIPPGAAPRFYASALPFDGYGSGVLVESHEGRPTKIEGNPRHPASLGATDIFAQAAVLDLWDPDRSQAVRQHGVIAGWEQFLAALQDQREMLEPRKGAGLRILSGAVSSPTLQGQLAALLQRYPQARRHTWQAWPRDNVHQGARLAFGAALEPVYRLDRAQVILALDADFLGAMPGRVRYARDFIDGRRVRGAPGRMNRLYAVEPTPSLTGCMADHRLAAGMTEIAMLARRLGAAFGIVTGEPELPQQQRRWLEAVAEDLRQHRGAALVLAGEAQPPEVHALVHALNAALDAPGRTVDYLEPVAPPGGSIGELADAMKAGEVRLLLMLGVNPVADTPADLGFGAALARVPCSVHLGQYDDETARLSTWHIPEAHALESWSDLRAHDGSASIVQPLLRPLYGGRSAHELLAACAGQSGISGHELVRDTWRPGHSRDFEVYWKACLQDGLVPGTAATPRHPTLRLEAIHAALQARPADRSGLELVIRPDPTVWDGRYANNGWLQELPKPASQLTWDNAVVIGTALAAQLGLHDGDEVLLRLNGREARGPVWISAAQASRSVTVFLGYGRRAAGRIGNHLGFDANLLRSRDALWAAQGLEVTPTGGHRELATTQQHFRMEGREPVRTATLAQFGRNPQVIRRAPREDGPFPSLYPERPPGAHAWALHIDLNACIGCKACTVACQAENNIPVVGADQVRRGRAMHWIRVDSYDDEAASAPHSLHQPVPCMHCEHAPCELVCPVEATVHDSEGLNLQTYNRCIGTRFCSNNCPYKVRRFNFLQYSDTTTESLKGPRNPQVTVRKRGVMEKCTYCVQRIRAAELTAEKDDRPIRDGEVRTACQAACPTQAISFGDLHDAGSAVVEARNSPLHYTLLAELNTRPRTTYSARLRNPNPALEPPA